MKRTGLLECCDKGHATFSGLVSSGVVIKLINMRKIIVIALALGSVACSQAGRRAGFADTFIRQDSGKISVTFDTVTIDHQVHQPGTYVVTRRVRTTYFAADRADRYETFRHVATESQESRSLLIHGSQRELYINEKTGNLISGSNEYTRLP